MRKRLIFMLAVLLLLGLVLEACGVGSRRSSGRGSGDDDSAADDDDSGADDDDDATDDDDDSGADDDDATDDDDDATDDDDTVPDSLEGTWFGVPSGSITVDSNTYTCTPGDSFADLDVDGAGFATGTISCYLGELDLPCAASLFGVPVMSGPTEAEISCVGLAYALTFDTDGATYLNGDISGTAESAGTPVTVDIEFALERDE